MHGLQTFVLPTLFCIAALALTPEHAVAQDESTLITYELKGKPIIIPAPAAVSRNCAAQVELEYFQKNTVASVEGTVDNEMCAASSGTYVLSIRTKDDNNTLATQEFTETWARADDQSVSFKADYAIGDNVELVRVRLMKTTCTCAVE
ncbi:MAG: hypothetical protein RLZZ227_1020 [Pseudomonadota bacterium]|jgi:hypothetical protein